MSIRIDTPPTLRGTGEEQLRQMVSYLYRLSDTLNIALDAIEGNQSAVKRLVESGGAGGGAQGTDGKGTTYNELRALIANTASYVRTETVRLDGLINDRYEAISEDFGTFRENITSSIEETARSVVTSYGYGAEIQTLQEQAAGFSEYRITTEGFIAQGFIDYDGDGVPILGIAIGQNLTKTEVVIGGETYQRIDGGQSCAFYTANRVSFRTNGVEVAYISNSKLYIRDVEINGSMQLGGKWQISHSNGFTIRWIGGNA